MSSTGSSHWGAFRVSGTGATLEVTPRPGDPDPTPLLGNIAGAHRHGSRVAGPGRRPPPPRRGGAADRGGCGGTGREPGGEARARAPGDRG
ncbi:hypothetical protein AB0C29_23795, partial [Actinoplanes sp. NPDC048791]|uniref:hypothetical protein n=1 Tax=Actinoplanes sp. NPDC048791 TaxID=3154623 RepID=UPI0033EF2140